MDRIAPREVDGAEGPEPATLVEDPVGDGGVDEYGPEDAEGEYRLQLRPLDDSAEY